MSWSLALKVLSLSLSLGVWSLSWSLALKVKSLLTSLASTKLYCLLIAATFPESLHESGTTGNGISDLLIAYVIKSRLAISSPDEFLVKLRCSVAYSLPVIELTKESGSLLARYKRRQLQRLVHLIQQFVVTASVNLRMRYVHTNNALYRISLWTQVQASENALKSPSSMCN